MRLVLGVEPPFFLFRGSVVQQLVVHAAKKGAHNFHEKLGPSIYIYIYIFIYLFNILLYSINIIYIILLLYMNV